MTNGISRSSGASWSASRVFYPKGTYEHPPAKFLQLRLVNRGSSYARIDLGVGVRRMFTRPGDLLLSLPDRPTAFHIEDRRELIMVQVAPAHASLLLEKIGGAWLDDLTPLLTKPLRDTLAAELCRRLERADEAAVTVNEWTLGLLLATLLAHARAASSPRRPVLSLPRLHALQDYVVAHLDEPHSIEALATRAQLPRRVFAALFREATGLPVHQYVLRQRALRAAELLASTDMPLAMIAAQCGFAHQGSHGTRGEALTRPNTRSDPFGTVRWTSGFAATGTLKCGGNGSVQLHQRQPQIPQR